MALSDEELRAKTVEFRERLANGESLDDLLPEAFATVREAAKRTLGQRHFDIQLVGGMVLHSGKISEMKTGEGKTLVSTLPAYLNALPGRGVHIVTVNDYLAKRDSEWMGADLQVSGLTVGCIVHDLDDDQRRQAYGCDITYGTNNEFGFDYLRDNMKYSVEEMVQFGGRPEELQGHDYAIVDEVDSILIDEARTPLIISGAIEDRSGLYQAIDKFIPRLAKEHFDLDEKMRTVVFTRGWQSAHGGDAGGGRVPEARTPRFTTSRTSPWSITRTRRLRRISCSRKRQGLHREEGPGGHHRRVHRPHDGRPALFGRPASGA